MRKTRDMSIQEIALELVRVTNSAPSSGVLVKIDGALDRFTGQGSAMLDKNLAAFHEHTKGYVNRVQRGYAGTSHWVQLRELSGKIAPALEILGATLEKENAR